MATDCALASVAIHRSILTPPRCLQAVHSIFKMSKTIQQSIDNSALAKEFKDNSSFQVLP